MECVCVGGGRHTDSGWDKKLLLEATQVIRMIIIVMITT